MFFSWDLLLKNFCHVELLLCEFVYIVQLEWFTKNRLRRILCDSRESLIYNMVYLLLRLERFIRSFGLVIWAGEAERSGISVHIWTWENWTQDRSHDSLEVGKNDTLWLVSTLVRKYVEFRHCTHLAKKSPLFTYCVTSHGSNICRAVMMKGFVFLAFFR